MIVHILQGRNAPAHPSRPKSDPDKPKGGGGRDKPARHEKPAAHRKPAAKPGAHKKQTHKPADHKPAAHKKTAGRGDLDIVWFEDVEFRPLAQGGHIQ